MLAKAELHVHLEGTATPQWVAARASARGIKLPEGLWDKSRQRFLWRDFPDFLNVYEIASGVIGRAEEYEALTYDYLARSAREGVIYAELTSSPDHAAKAGLSFEGHLEGIVAGIQRARAAFGIEARILIACVRHYGVAACEAVLDKVLFHRHPLVVGIGLAGDESAFPPALFSRLFKRAQAAGLGCTAHAGEFTGPNGVRDAVHALGICRLGHGVRASEDPRCVAELAAAEVTLEVCPGSNIALGIYSEKNHPLRLLYEAGVKVTLNADDPPYFGTTIGEEYNRAMRVWGFSEAALLSMTRTAIRSSFADSETKERLLEPIQNSLA